MSTDRLTDQQMDAMVVAVAAGDFTFDRDAPTPDLPPKPGPEVMAVYSMRLPADVAERLTAVARSKGVKPSTLMRQYVEWCLATEANDRPISLADAFRALSQLRPAA